MEKISAEDIVLVIAPEVSDTERARVLSKKFKVVPGGGEAYLKYDKSGLAFCCGSQSISGDFTRLAPRLKGNALKNELLIRAAKLKEGETTAVDATAGLGDDSFFLAAAGCRVTLFEKNPIIFELLCDAIDRASRISGLDAVVSRMTAINADSIPSLRRLAETPDIVFLDPMFPERQKSALVKKKLQMIQRLEAPCIDEAELFLAAVGAGPSKLIIKRPPKGAYLAGIKPDYSIEGKAVRFDCIVSPSQRAEKYKDLLK